MNEESSNNTGINNNLVWWHGFVEDVNDPLKLGRCRVRIFGIHTYDKKEIPTESLPWAVPIMPSNSSSASGLGISPTGILPGTWVLGFFRDGESCQQPMILGTYGGINRLEGITSKNKSLGFNDPSGKLPKSVYIDEPDVNKLARNEDIENTIVEKKRNDLDDRNPTALGGSWSEPSTPYNAIYPKNHVYESESGHVFEIDDTPGSERLHKYHKSGTFEEIHPDGSKVEKIIGDDYMIVRKNNHVSIYGNSTVNVGNDIKIASGRNVDVQIGGNARVLVSGSLTAKVGGSSTIQTGGNVRMQTGGNFTHFVKGSYTVISGGLMSLLAPKVSLNPGVGFSLGSVGFSLGLNTNKSAPAKITTTTPKRKIVLELDDGRTITTDEDRKVKTSNRGTVNAIDLTEEDDIISLV